MISDWPSVQISEVCELIIDCVNKTAPVVDGPTPYKMIRTTNVRDGRQTRDLLLSKLISGEVEVSELAV